MGQKITETKKKKYWRKKTAAAPTRGMHEKSSVFGGIWLRAALIRAIKTMGQAALSAIGVALYMEDVNWLAVLSTAVLSGIISMLTSIKGLPEVDQQMYFDTIEEVSDDE